MKKKWWRVTSTCAAVVFCAGVMVTSIASAQNRAPARTHTTTAVKAGSGGTATVAYLPGDMPNYIFPMIAPASDTPADIFWFIEQFWRPLFWFGGAKGGSGFNESLSLAYQPTFSADGRTATIKLKGWKWSDGKTITARDVEFWINLFRNDRSGYANYIPGNLPDNVTAFHYINPMTSRSPSTRSTTRTGSCTTS